MSDFILDRENVSQIAVVTVCPDVSTVLSANQLSRDADARPGLPHTSLQNEINAEALRHCRHLDRFALVSEDGVPCHHEQAGNFREIGDDVFGNAVTEIFLLGIAAHVYERKHRDGGSFLPRCRRGAVP